jgi:hypothetical protein
MVRQAGDENVSAFMSKLVEGSSDTDHLISPRNVVDGDAALGVVDEVTSERG